MFPLKRNKERPVMDAILRSLQRNGQQTKDELICVTGFKKVQIKSAIADLMANGEIKHDPTGKGYVLYMPSK